MFIALLSFILLFSISCESNEESSKPPYKPPTPKHELEGTWVGYDEKDKNYIIKFTVDSEGNITFFPKPAIGNDDLPLPYSYKGKVETNSIVYPYTVKISNSYIDYIDEEDKENRVFTFSNSSSCTAIYTRLEGIKDNYPTITGGVTVEFTKQ